MSDKLLDHLKRALGDTYTIERELSGAGMSRVFVAQEHSLGREVVIKVLPRELAAGVNRERFQQEVQLAARLSHPYIVPLLHAGEHEDLLWFTMPYITGESLKYRLETQGPVPVREVVQLAHDIVEALAYAHSRGVMHRDIKPANILVDGGHAVVTDFGVAKALSAAMPTMGSGHTTTGMAIGTPAYMAPEQLAADPAADHRVDIYAMGLLMYELLAGTSPFSNQSPTATMTAQLTRMPEPLSQVRKDVPPALSALIMRCLAKSPDERPASAEEVLKSLDQISGELAAAEHGSGQQSAVVRRLIPITGLLAFVTVAAAATMIWASRRNSGELTPVPPVTPPSAASGDTGQLAVLQPGDTVTMPRSREDSIKLCERFADPTSRGKCRTPVVAGKTSVRDTVFVMPNIDSLVKAALDSQLKSAQINIPRPGSFDPSRFPPGSTAIPGAAIANRNGPMKAVVVTFSQGRGGGVIDTASKVISDRLIGSLTESAARRNWQMVLRDPSRPPNYNDSVMAASNAVIIVSLTRSRNSRDSLELMLTVRNPAGGIHYVTKSVPATIPAPEFGDVVGQTSIWLRDLRNNPGVSWDPQGSRNGQQNFRGFGPPGGGGPGGDRGGGQGGDRSGGGRGGGGGQRGGRDSSQTGGGTIGNFLLPY